MNTEFCLAHESMCVYESDRCREDVTAHDRQGKWGHCDNCSSAGLLNVYIVIFISFMFKGMSTGGMVPTGYSLSDINISFHHLRCFILFSVHCEDAVYKARAGGVSAPNAAKEAFLCINLIKERKKKTENITKSFSLLRSLSAPVIWKADFWLCEVSKRRLGLQWLDCSGLGPASQESPAAVSEGQIFQRRTH